MSQPRTTCGTSACALADDRIIPWKEVHFRRIVGSGVVVAAALLFLGVGDAVSPLIYSFLVSNGLALAFTGVAKT